MAVSTWMMKTAVASPSASRVSVYGGLTLTTTAVGDGTWSVTADALAAGPHTVKASVKDAAGNSGTATQVLVVEVNPALVDVGSAASYRVLAATGAANTGLTMVDRDLGVTTVATISGFPLGIVTGTTHDADSSATQARADRATAYADADGRTPDSSFSGDLGGVTFRASVHHTAAALALTAIAGTTTAAVGVGGHA